MKAVILAGGLGTRISEEALVKPKPMIEVGGKPLLWHIMKLYSSFGVHEFVICCGYKGYVIKEYFANYRLHMSDVTIDMASNAMHVHHQGAEPWKVTLVDTGDRTSTGGRLKRVEAFIRNDAQFCLTYGDGLSDLDIGAELAFHREHGRLATITGVRPPSRYGAMQTRDRHVVGFTAQPDGDAGLANGGFFVLSPQCLPMIDGDETSWENEVLVELAAADQLMVFEHLGFFQPVDAMRDQSFLESLWGSGRAPWKLW